ncbi:MAG: GNAT family N-acetyltransferase, partial [Anaerolineaceae bacterium]|nr:GNAT family N-acetyltransferase [Anaerolineaceae bacterium]
MTVATFQPTTHIRKVNIHEDLLAVADLIEICFASTLDDDGRDYLRQLRWTARDASYLSWLQGAAERISMPLYGFVWEENGQIAGNLSLIPLYRRGKVFYLIANVAVHPDYRRRGIGRQLTQTALDHLRQRGIDSAWLQVRDDNPAAYDLYRSLGFTERARRTTWLASTTPPYLLRHLTDGITIHPRHSEDWRQQSAWLRQVYPSEVSWNLPLHPARFSPGLWNRILSFIRGEEQEHWTARRGSDPIGFLTWEPLRTSTDLLWLAAPVQEEELAILSLLPYAREALSYRRRPLSINYPA